MTIRAYLDNVSVAGSPIGVSSKLTDITALAAESNLELNTCKCIWCPDLRPAATSTPPTLLPLRRAEGLSLVPVPFRQTTFVQMGIDTLLER